MYDATIKTVPHNKQRYNTVGDYRTSPFDGTIVFRITDLKDWRMEFLIAIHEMIEQAITRRDGITEQEIDEFDIQYEVNRKPGDISEPGDQPTAPYYRAHQIATFAEAALAVQLGVDWQQYERRINEVGGQCGK